MRFDDSLATVLRADDKSDLGARAAWRQIVDLVGRGRAAPDPPLLNRLRTLRSAVPAETRAATARLLEHAEPPVALVAFFAEDTPDVSTPVLRTARLTMAAWQAILPRIGPAGRSVLRGRRDLPDAVVRALEALGPVDRALNAPAPELARPSADAPHTGVSPRAAAAHPPPPPPPPLPPPDAKTERPTAPAAPPRFEIAELAARIAAFQRDRPARSTGRSDHAAADPSPMPPAEPADRSDDLPISPVPKVSNTFAFETDAQGVIRWVGGGARAALVGVSLAVDGERGLVRLDAVAAAALRQRQPFRDARLELGGLSPASGSWRLSGTPMFDAVSGRFAGIRGSGRRPRRDEEAASEPAPDALRQLVHELRTPTNAIMGFAELIGAELFGEVPDRYRARAETIRTQAAALIGAIEDLDTAARIEGSALELRAGAVILRPLLTRIVADLEALAALRRVDLVLGPVAPDLVLMVDDRAAERLIARLLAAIIAAGGSGERIGIAVARTDAVATLAIDRPCALTSDEPDAILRWDGMDAGAEGAPLLGIAFTVRLARNLAREMGGELRLDPTSLTLRLPATILDRPLGHTAAG